MAASKRRALPGGKRQWTLERPAGERWRWRSKVDPTYTIGYVDGRARRRGRFVKTAIAHEAIRQRQEEGGVLESLLALLGTARGGFRRGWRDAWPEAGPRGVVYEARATDLPEGGDDFAERWRRILEDEEGSTLQEVRERHRLPMAPDPEDDFLEAHAWEIDLPDRRVYKRLLADGWIVFVSVEAFTYQASHNPVPEQRVPRRRRRGGRSGKEKRRNRTPVGAVERPGSPYWRPIKGQARATGTARRIARIMSDKYEGELLGVGLRLRAERVWGRTWANTKRRR